MEITLKGLPMKVVNIPWRNNNLSSLHADPPFSEQGETIIGVYLLVLGESTTYTDFKYTFYLTNSYFHPSLAFFVYPWCWSSSAGLCQLIESENPFCVTEA